MATQGTVTITARVNSTQAETALRSLGGAARQISVDYRSLAGQQAKAAQSSAKIAMDLQEQMEAATLSSSEARVRVIRREHEQTDAQIRAMALSRTEKEKLIYQNAATMEARITQITVAESQKQARAVAEAAERETRARQEASKAAIKAHQDALKVAEESRQAELRSMNKGSSAGSSIGFGTIVGGSMVGNLAANAAMQAWEGVKNAIRGAVDEAARYESSMKTLEIVSKATGAVFEDNKALVSEFSDAISSPAAAAQAVRVFTTMNMSMDEQRKLITGIRDGLVAMGMDVNEQLPLMALAIKRQESVLLDNMGVTRTIEMMYKEYAKTLGVSVDKLTQQQKEQAVVNGVLKETSVYAGTAKSSTETYTGSVNNLKAAQAELGKEIGDVVNPALTDMNNLLAEGVRNMAAFTREFPKTLLEGGRGLTPETRAAGNRSRIVGENAPINTKDGGLVIPGLTAGMGLPNLKVETDAERKAREKAALEAAEKAREAAEKAAEERKKAAEKAAKEQQQVAERNAADQRRLREQLNRDLALIDLAGFDKQRAQAMQAHQERLRLAHENNALMVQSRELYYAEIAKIDAEQAAQAETNNAQVYAKLGIGMGDGNTFVARDPVQEQQQVHDLFKQHFGERDKAEQDLIDKRKRAEEELGQMWRQYIEDAANTVGSFAAKAIRTGEGPSGGDMTRTGANTIASGLSIAAVGASGTVVGLPAGVALAAAAALTKIGGEIVGAIFDRNDDAAQVQKQAAEDQKRAAEEQLRAAKQRADDAFGAGSNVEDQTRWLNWEKMLADAKGTDRYDDLKAEYDKQQGIEDRLSDFKGSLAGIAKVAGGYDDVTMGGFAKSARFYASDGEFSADDLKSLESGRYGEILRDAKENGMWGTLVQALQNLADGIALEGKDVENRILPGSSPQTPSYNVIVNFKEMWAWAPKDANFRSGGPGTRREGSSDRAIKVSNR